MTQSPNINIVWRRIEDFEGEEFQQIRGARFTYTIAGNVLIPSRTNRQIPRSQFEKALNLMPARNTVPLHHLQGPSYLYAILMDPRVRLGDW